MELFFQQFAEHVVLFFDFLADYLAYDVTDENDLLFANTCTDLRAVIHSDLYADRCANLYAHNVSDGATQLRPYSDTFVRPDSPTDFDSDIFADASAVVSAHDRALCEPVLLADSAPDSFSDSAPDIAANAPADAPAVVSAYARTLCEPVLRSNGATVTFPDFRADISADVYAIARSDENAHFLANSATHTVPDGAANFCSIVHTNLCADADSVA